MDDDGLLSIDFLAGFTIFLLAFIMVVSMIPGLLVGIQSRGIDYDAVAYRTSVILVEDPGCANSLDGDYTLPTWELRQYSTTYKDEIQRMGLSVSANTPNIIARGKVNKFFNNSSGLILTYDDYRSKTIFGEIPYYFNISLKVGSEPALMAGEPVPHGSYGYARRLVMVKDPGYAVGNSLVYNATGCSLEANETHVISDIAVQLNYSELIDLSRSEAYQINPATETVYFNITDFSPYLDRADIDNVTLKGVTFYKKTDSGLFKEIPFQYDYFDNRVYQFYKNNEQHKLSSDPFSVKDMSYMNMTLTPPLPLLPDEPNALVFINYTLEYYFNNDTQGLRHPYLTGVYDYNYNSVIQPNLKPGVLEVAIW